VEPCVFCAPAQLDLIYEDAEALAFLDHDPLFHGHTLLIPRRHVATLDRLLPGEAASLMEKLRILNRAVPRALECDGCMTCSNRVVNQSVPHLHWHLIPRRHDDGLENLFQPRQPYRDRDHQTQVQSRLRAAMAQELILDFWFGPPQDNGLSHPSFRQRWFGAEATFDAEIQNRFGNWVERALAGEFAAWADSARGTLALILLLDPFTRNLFRHQRRAFDGDEQALALAQACLDKGLEQQLGWEERVFLYLPFEHSESWQGQQRSLERFTALSHEVPSEHREQFALYRDFAQRHADIIRRWGRYPHRNQALGRSATPEEEEFLKQPGSSFW